MVDCRSCSLSRDGIRVSRYAIGGPAIIRGRADVSTNRRIASFWDPTEAPVVLIHSVGHRDQFPGLDRGAGIAEPSRGHF